MVSFGSVLAAGLLFSASALAGHNITDHKDWCGVDLTQYYKFGGGYTYSASIHDADNRTTSYQNVTKKWEANSVLGHHVTLSKNESGFREDMHFTFGQYDWDKVLVGCGKGNDSWSSAMASHRHASWIFDNGHDWNDRDDNFGWTKDTQNSKHNHWAKLRHARLQFDCAGNMTRPFRPLPRPIFRGPITGRRARR